MPGIAELAAAINGQYVRTRHLDYRLFAPAAGDYLAMSEIPAPAVPASVSAQPTVDAEISEMREYYRAYAARDIARRDYREHFRWTLTALEVWPELITDTRQFAETTNGFRHAETQVEMRAQQARALERLASGFNDLLENISIIPGSIRQVSASGKPALALWRWRITCADIGSVGDYPPDTTLELVDRPHARWHHSASIAQYASSRNARYRINYDGRADPLDGLYSGKAMLDAMMEALPGLDGPGPALTESYAGIGSYAHGTTSALNVRHYNRAYSMAAGAVGRTNMLRGWNDPTLFVARTTRPEVAGVEADSSYKWSYAIPLELILRHPAESWNPYALDAQRIADGGVTPSGAGTLESPYSHALDNGYWFLTPSTFFSGAAGEPDPADTGASDRYVLDSGGIARVVQSSGTWIHLPAIAGIAEPLRCRYPIYPLYHDANPALAMAEAQMGDLGLGQLALGNEILALRLRVDELQRRLRPAERMSYHLWLEHHA
jgi:hypothetical protein